MNKTLLLLAVASHTLLSCECVIGFQGFVTDTNNVPLDDVVVYRCFEGVKTDSFRYPMGLGTDSCGRFEIITMTSVFSRKAKYDFIFEKDGFVPDTVQLKSNAFDSLPYIIQLKRIEKDN